MAGDGTSFEIDVAVKAAGVTSAAAAVAALSDQLQSAGDASTAAADAVRAGQAAFKEAEGNADRAARAVEKLGLAAEAQREKLAKLAAGNANGIVNVKQYQAAAERLAKLTARQDEAVAKSSAAAAAVTTEAAALEKLGTAAATAVASQAALSAAAVKAKSSHDAATKAYTAAAAAAADASKRQVAAATEAQKKSATAAADVAKKAAGSGQINEMGEAFGKLGGPLGSVGQKALGAAEGFKKMGAALGNAGPYAAAAVAIVAIAAAVAAVAAAAVVAVASVAAWAAGLADAARSQSLLAQGIAQSVSGGRALAALVGKIQDRVPLTRDALLGLAKPLVDAGLKGNALADALEAAAVKAATVKFGPAFASEMRSLPNLTARLQRNFGRIFSGLKIEPLLAALAKMVDLFDDGSASSNAISVVFESLFQPLIDGVTAFAPKAVAAFIQFEILVLKALIAVKPFAGYILVVAGIFGALALVIAGVLAYALVSFMVTLGALSALFAVVVAVVMGVAAAFVYVAFKIGEAGAAVYTHLKGAFDWLATLSLSEIAIALIDGLVAGLVSAGPKVLAAMKGLADGAINAAKNALGIASPSTVFAEIGMHTAAGMTEGVDGEAGAVASSLESMVAPPEAVTGGASASAGGGGTVFNINVSGGGNAQAVADAIREVIADLLTQTGGAAPSNA